MSIITPMTRLSETANHHLPHRGNTSVEIAERDADRQAPGEDDPEVRARLGEAGRICAAPGLRDREGEDRVEEEAERGDGGDKRTSRIRIGPRRTRNVLPCSTCALRSIIASQIHIAGRISISMRRQFENSSRSPVNSMANAPTRKASGAR